MCECDALIYNLYVFVHPNIFYQNSLNEIFRLQHGGYEDAKYKDAHTDSSVKPFINGMHDFIFKIHFSSRCLLELTVTKDSTANKR